MRIAVPVAGGTLCVHFGQCTHFAVFDVDPDAGVVTARRDLAAPDHEPGVFPVWLGERGANVVIAAGMGSRAREVFAANGIDVVTGATGDDPGEVVTAFLADALRTDPNVCDR